MLLASLILFSIITLLVIRYRAEDHSQYDKPQASLVISEDKVSPQHNDVVDLLKQYHRHSSLDVKKARIHMEEFFKRKIESVTFTPINIDGLPAEWVIAEGADPKKRLLYIHGGAFRIGSPKSHRYITSELSRLAGISVLAIDYRMQPEFKTIDCHMDVRKAYKWIIENGPDKVEVCEYFFVAGDSAGGNLSLSVVAWARDQSLRPVDGVIAMAPLTDSTMGAASWKTNQHSDPFLGPSMGRLILLPRFLIALIMRLPIGRPVNDPEVSPLLGRLSGLPKTLIQVSQDEMLFDDSQRYANKAIAAGNDLTLQVWPKMVHIFQAFGPELPEANDALRRISKFIENCTEQARP
ncbi:MAG: alpha/beta hydrolase [Pseudomonadales bacterium]|nr:alpha/beta hydrolase [Pseudomonadales bacterium]